MPARSVQNRKKHCPAQMQTFDPPGARSPAASAGTGRICPSALAGKPHEMPVFQGFRGGTAFAG
jgi:hypothetical protein